MNAITAAVVTNSICPFRCLSAFRLKIYVFLLFSMKKTIIVFVSFTISIKPFQVRLN